VELSSSADSVVPLVRRLVDVKDWSEPEDQQYGSEPPCLVSCSTEPLTLPRPRASRRPCHSGSGRARWATCASKQTAKRRKYATHHCTAKPRPISTALATVVVAVAVAVAGLRRRLQVSPEHPDWGGEVSPEGVDQNFVLVKLEYYVRQPPHLLPLE